MKKKILSLTLITIIVSIIFSLGFATRVEATVSYGYGIGNRPLKVYAASNFNSNEISQLKQAIDAWNSTKFGTFFVYGGTVPYWTIPNYNVSDGLTTVSKYPLSGLATGGTLNFGIEGVSITESNILINSNLSYNYGSPTSGDYYLKSVLMHELGHAVGLDDNYDHTESIMYYAYTGSTNISNYDLADLETLY